ncbi:MAG: hypothetical protein PHO66_02070 [Eubacteriales bacterium]|nr:hypothetical protein [Eubacteriales bacterium]
MEKLISGTAKANTPSVKLLCAAGFHITAQSTESFFNDEKGRPILLAGYAFACVL